MYDGTSSPPCSHHERAASRPSQAHRGSPALGGWPLSIGPGSIINDSYRVVRRIAVGGMATVYEAILLATGQRVALKIPHDQFRADKDGLKRFLREARAAMAVRADNVIQIVAVGRLPNKMPFLAMEYIDGVGLRDVMYPPDDKRLSTQMAMMLVDQIAAAVSSAHAAGVIHRDLKPDNVLITFGPSGPVAKVFDFGLSFVSAEFSSSRLTTTGTTFGTPQYMAPEQIRGAKHVDGRVDVYALGVILYEMLAARWPFEGSDTHEVWHKATYDPPVPLSEHRPDLPRELLDVVMRTISRDAADRYATADEFRAAIAPFWSSEASASSPAPPLCAVLPPGPPQSEALVHDTEEAVTERPTPSPTFAAAREDVTPSPSPPQSAIAPDYEQAFQNRQRMALLLAVGGAMLVVVAIALVVALRT